MKMLMKALEDTGNSSYFEDRFLIGRQLFGFRTLNFMDQLHSILRLYDETQKIYIDLEKDRTASLGTQFRAYVSLYALGIDVDRSDFRIPNDSNSIIFHQNPWKIMFDEVDRKDRLENRDRHLRYIAIL